MFDSMVRNKTVLQRMQEENWRNNNIWPNEFHFSVDGCNIIEVIVSVLQSMKSCTTHLSNCQQCIGDLINN